MRKIKTNTTTKALSHKVIFRKISTNLDVKVSFDGQGKSCHSYIKQWSAVFVQSDSFPFCCNAVCGMRKIFRHLKLWKLQPRKRSTAYENCMYYTAPISIKRNYAIFKDKNWRLFRMFCLFTLDMKVSVDNGDGTHLRQWSAC